MNRDDAKLVLFVRAVELADPEGVLLPHAVRNRCTSEASPPGSEASAPRSGCSLSTSEQAYVLQRAKFAAAELDRRMSGWPLFRDSLDLAPHLLRWLPLAALICGFLTSRSWSGDELNLLGLPLYTVLLWNIAVYGYLIYSAWRPYPRPTPTGPLRASLRAWANHYTAKLARVAIDRPEEHRGAVSARVAARFLHEWTELQSSLITVRGAELLHLCAAALAGGLALGLLAFGLVGRLGDLDPGWRTNFPKLMTPELVHALLSTTLGPASAVTGRAIPSVEEIGLLRFGNEHQSASAEGWLVLSIASLIIYVVMPRLALWGVARRRASKIRNDFYSPSNDDSYYRHLIKGTHGAGQIAGVVWHHIELTSELQTRVRAALRSTLGGRIKLDFVSHVGYGQEGDVLALFPDQDPRDRLAVLFSIADTPEDEIQGELIQQLASHGTLGQTRPPLVLLDLGPYERFRAAPDFRHHFDERLHTWQQFVTDHQAEVILLDSPSRDNAKVVSG